MKDTKENLICPECGEEMKKIYLKEQGFYVDICLNGCGGILFDNREFQKVDENHEKADEIFESYKNKQFRESDSKKQLQCPICGATMVKNGMGINSLFNVDECYACGAKFLNYGELEKIRKRSDTEKEKDINDIKSLIQMMEGKIGKIEL